MTPHYIRGTVFHTTWFWKCLGTAFGHFFWALTISWSRLLACVWSGPYLHDCTLSAPRPASSSPACLSSLRPGAGRQTSHNVVAVIVPLTYPWCERSGSQHQPQVVVDERKGAAGWHCIRSRLDSTFLHCSCITLSLQHWWALGSILSPFCE